MIVCPSCGEENPERARSSSANGFSRGRLRRPAALHAPAPCWTTKAVLAAMRGEREEAAALFRAAAEGWQQWGSLVEGAYTLHDLGRCGDLEAAREADAIFERLRARPFVALAA